MKNLVTGSDEKHLKKGDHDEPHEIYYGRYSFSNEMAK